MVHGVLVLSESLQLPRSRRKAVMLFQELLGMHRCSKCNAASWPRIICIADRLQGVVL